MRRPRSGREPRDVLERHYRWLLAVYPASYRTANAEEIVGVGLARARDGQRWPGLGEALSLVRGGLGIRRRGLISWARQPVWGTAFAAFAALGAIVVATINTERVTSALASYFPARVSPAELVLAAGWLLTAVAAVAAWHRVAAVTAGLATAAQIAWLAGGYGRGPWALVTSWWQLVLAVTVAVAAILAGAGPGSRPLGRWAAAGLLAVAVLVVAAPGISAAVTTVRPAGSSGIVVVSSPLDGVWGLLRDGLVVLLALAAAGGIVSGAGAARRRVLVLTLPAVAAGGVTAWGFGGFLAASPRFSPPVLLTGAQWAVLVIVPVAAAAVGAVWLAHFERMLRHAAEHPEAVS